MAELSADSIRKYVDDPYHCPYCDSEKMDVSDVTLKNEGKHCWQKAECSSCKKVWTEFFTLTIILGIAITMSAVILVNRTTSK